MTSNKGGSVYSESVWLSWTAPIMPYRTDWNDEEKPGRTAYRNTKTDCFWDLNGWVYALFSHTADHTNGAERVGSW